MKITISILMVAATVGANAQVYRCTVNGRAVYADAPCGTESRSIDARPAAGTSPSTSSVGTPDPATESSAALAKRADVAARRRILNDDIDRKQARIKTLRGEMEQRLEALKAKKSYARNNLAGAVWEQSISDEMMAVATSYDNKIRSEERELSELRKQLSEIPKL